MQLFIVILLICGSSAYLAFKWLPKKHKRKLSAWLIKKMPKVFVVLNTPDGGCSGGCSSCGACEQPVTKNNSNKEIKIIRIIPNFSHLN